MKADPFFTSKEKMTWRQRLVTVVVLLIGIAIVAVVASNTVGVRSHHCPTAFPNYQSATASVPALCVSATDSTQYVSAP